MEKLQRTSTLVQIRPAYNYRRLIKAELRKWKVVPTEKGNLLSPKTVGFLSFQSLETGVSQWEFPTVILPGAGRKVSVLYASMR